MNHNIHSNLNLITVIFPILSGFLRATTTRAAEPGKPNIIYIMSDDVGWGDLTTCGFKPFGIGRSNCPSGRVRTGRGCCRGGVGSGGPVWESRPGFHHRGEGLGRHDDVCVEVHHMLSFVRRVRAAVFQLAIRASGSVSETHSSLDTVLSLRP